MKKLLSLTLLSASLSAFDGNPWVIEPFKPDVKAVYAYSFFSKVHGYSKNFKNNQMLLSMDVAFPNYVQLSLELDQDASTFNSFYFRDAAVELKMQFSDDVAEGDILSSAAGIRGIAQTTQGRLDPATLYPGGYHGVFFFSFGKEFTFDPEHFLRLFALAGLGMATHSSLFADLDAEISYRNYHHEFKIFALSSLGYGSQQWVDINHFDGWGHKRYRYLDLGFTYGYEVSSQTFLKFGFTKRSVSKVMPRNYNNYSLILEKIF